MSLNPAFRSILLTGAAGNLGRLLRGALRGSVPLLRLSDIREMDPAQAGEETVVCDLADFEAVRALMEGIDLVLHFGGIPEEDRWDRILSANIAGAHNVWEAARLAGVKRIVFASSNHAIGMYRRTRRIDTDAAPRPDTFYGLSKAFGEQIARMYWDKHGIESVCLRIGSCFPEPRDERMLATWLSYDDLTRLCRCCIEAPMVDFTVAYGVSANSRRWWDNSRVAYLGYRPHDSADCFAAGIAARGELRLPSDPAVRFQGGHFVPPGYTGPDN